MGSSHSAAALQGARVARTLAYPSCTLLYPSGWIKSGPSKYVDPLVDLEYVDVLYANLNKPWTYRILPLVIFLHASEKLATLKGSQQR